MRLGISLLNFRPGKIGGTETFVRQLLAHLPAVAPSDALVAVLYRDLAAALETPGFERVVVDRGDAAVVAARVLEAYTPWRDRGLERLLASLRLDVVLFPQQSIFPKEAPVRAALTAVDVQHLIFPDNFGLFDRTFRAAIYPRSLARAEKVIAISRHVRKTILELCGLAEAKVVAIPLGYAPRVGSADEAPYPGIGSGYLYYPAYSHPHKNHATLLRTYAALRASGAITAPLVLTGGQTAHWKRLERLVDELGLRDQVRHLGLLSYPEVRRVYAGAAAVLFPTRYEGFGLPVLEAVEAGKKVITSRLEVFDEIGVPRCYQIDFSSPEELRAALDLPGATVLERKPGTWRDMAAAYATVLRELAAAPPRAAAGSDPTRR
jgi:glycosyltransferase involved in cell wall biosynthesis